MLAVPLAGRDLTKGAYLLELARESRQECAVFFGGPSARGAAGTHGPRGEAGRCELFVSLVMSRFVKKNRMLAGICVSVFSGRAVEINVLVFGWSRRLSSHRGRGCFSGNVIPASSFLLPARRGGGEGGEGGGQAGQRQPETLNFYGSKRDKACPESGHAGRDPL